MGDEIGNHSWAGCSLVNERPVGNSYSRQPAAIVYRDCCRHEVAIGIAVTSPQLCHLADPSGDRVLVTVNTRGRIVDRTKTVCGCINLLECCPVGIMCSLVNQAVG